MDDFKNVPVISVTGEEEKLEDDNEEEKIEKFISLIRKCREARDLRMKELTELQKKKKRKVLDCNQECSSWVPTFEIQDFNVPQLSGVLANVCNSIGSKEGRKEHDHEEDAGVDLRLTL
ncbi:hypothetical protein POM88_008586 [Heracleum sosnowskyi]|uniref:Uncharacterized protein n=1 Tax=Heracleum sosnowskyi TaxID=360622 RepID=A0AAD8J7H1_9APIA|nr:hypothetical protein POM88_008586 [Heracleum sosnowskyi]